jgi:predicted lipoprotein with Yx(FWY)xxD motif
MRNRRWIAAAGVIAAALVVSACGSGSTAASGTNYGDVTTGQATSGAGAAAQSMPLRAEASTAGTVLASSSGLTLYYYTGDKQGSGMSACSGSCASAWPPLAAPVVAPAGVTMPGPIGTITRSDGVKQVTINGYPAYTYSGDKGPGQVSGNGIAGTWHAFMVSGMTAAGGLMEVRQTSAGKVLANPHGMTVYYFTGDTRGSGKSACVGNCIKEWPAVIAPVRIPSGVKLPGPVGSIVRPDGARQVTINGYPIYRYAGDSAPGEATGNGLGGQWHVITIGTSTSAGAGSGSSGSGSGGSGSGGSGGSGW